MNGALLSAHSRAAVLAKGRRIAADLADKACDPASALGMTDRLAHVALACAIDAEASKLAGVEPLTDAVRAQLADALVRAETAA